jgi:hypothetical protein
LSIHDPESGVKVVAEKSDAVSPEVLASCALGSDVPPPSAFGLILKGSGLNTRAGGEVVPGDF